jgi:pantoate--beta-alanine ligase
MEIAEKIADLQRILALRSAVQGQGAVGFVPTMGALHKGHASLIQRARKENGTVVCSIFVNPTQFTDPSDLINYPRTLQADMDVASEAGCNVLFAPSVQEIYPGNSPRLLDIDFGPLERVMEGTFRPGHFQGVATVVHRLFDIVKPDHAYFGEKDFQQLAVVRDMVRRMSLPVRITGCPTLRDSDGLAMSSRNVRLSTGERASALVLSKALFQAQQQARTLPLPRVLENARELIAGEPGVDLEYFEIVDAATLQPLGSWSESEARRACVAARVGHTRLIDNMGI